MIKINYKFMKNDKNLAIKQSQIQVKKYDFLNNTFNQNNIGYDFLKLILSIIKSYPAPGMIS